MCVYTLVHKLQVFENEYYALFHSSTLELQNLIIAYETMI